MRKPCQGWTRQWDVIGYQSLDGYGKGSGCKHVKNLLSRPSNWFHQGEKGGPEGWICCFLRFTKHPTVPILIQHPLSLLMPVLYQIPSLKIFTSTSPSSSYYFLLFISTTTGSLSLSSKLRKLLKFICWHLISSDLKVSTIKQWKK